MFVEPRDVAAHQIGRRGGHQEAERRGDAGAERADDPAQLEQPREAVGVHRAGAAEGDQRVAARVPALLGDVHAGGRRHVLVDDLVDADGRGSRRRARAGGRCAPRWPASTASAVERHLAAEEVVGVESSPAPGRRRSPSAAFRRGRSRPARARRRRCRGPTFSRPIASTRAIEPPPAPISIMSTTGTLSGRPEPFRKRRTRPASNSCLWSGPPPSTRHIFAVVPPMSNEIRLEVFVSRP